MELSSKLYEKGLLVRLYFPFVRVAFVLYSACKKRAAKTIWKEKKKIPSPPTLHQVTRLCYIDSFEYIDFDRAPVTLDRYSSSSSIRFPPLADIHSSLFSNVIALDRLIRRTLGSGKCRKVLKNSLFCSGHPTRLFSDNIRSLIL